MNWYDRMVITSNQFVYDLLMDQRARQDKLAPAVTGFTSSGVGPKVDLEAAIEEAKYGIEAQAAPDREG